MKIDFNNALNFTDLKRAYGADDRLRIERFLDAPAAQAVGRTLATEVPYQLALFHDGENLSITDTQLQQLPATERRSIEQGLMQNASKGIGFAYARHELRLSSEPNPVLRGLHEWLNSEAVLAWVRDLSGHRDVVAASAQATRYNKGQFLTRHRDTHPGEQRRVAYVINLTSSWHPDWGGLLQFFEDDGTPRDAWSPGFNVLSLFDVRHIHSVTYVAPYAMTPRLSVTGWFLATPLSE